MGEKIRDLGQITIKKTLYTIELNEPTVKEAEREIHFQSDCFRLALSESAFIKMACTFIEAKKQLKQLKGDYKCTSIEKR